MTHHNKDGQTTNVSISKLKAIKKIEVENCKTHVHSLVQVSSCAASSHGWFGIDHLWCWAPPSGIPFHMLLTAIIERD